MTSVVKASAKGEVVETSEKEGGVVKSASADQFLGAIIEASRDPSVDLGKMRVLFDMRNELLAEEARKAFNSALSSVKALLPSVGKNKPNEHTKSRYADLAAIADAVDPIIGQAGFGLTFSTEDSPKEHHYRIVAVLSHDGGHEKKYVTDIPVDGAGMKGGTNKTATHSFGSTISYGRRYLKLMIFDIATGDDNDGNRRAQNEPEDLGFITPEQVTEIEILMGHAKADKAKFLDWLGCDTIETIPAGAYYQRAIHALKAKRDAAAEEGETK